MLEDIILIVMKRLPTKRAFLAKLKTKIAPNIFKLLKATKLLHLIKHWNSIKR